MKLSRAIFGMVICATVLIASAARAGAGPATQAGAATQPAGQLSLDVVTEEGQKLIRATLTAGGKPVEDATISFGVRRTFGVLVLGQDKTLDDGTAAVPFPADLPGSAEGVLKVVAKVTAPAAFASVEKEASFGGAVKVDTASHPLPRALWSPHAPVELIIPIVVLLAGVWSTYAFAIAQIIAIKKGAKP